MVDSVTPNEQHDVGTAVKIECKKKFVLFGEEEIICQTDGSWSSIPLCKRLGESSPLKTNLYTTLGCLFGVD